jgi:pimeloyl-ACP methyl ester carboxylesterase
MSSPQPFKVDVPQERLEKIERRIREYEWHEMPSDGGWSYGANLDYMKEICAYWVDEFDWRRAEEGLNRFPQFTLDIEGIPIHYIEEKGSGTQPRSLILNHGWPGSVFEFVHIIDQLAHPEKYGGSVDDAFTVIAPSLVGYGFSGKPAGPIGPRAMARYMAKLMDALGHRNYIAEGGDWGALVSAWMAFDDDERCGALHLSMYGVRPGSTNPNLARTSMKPETDEEIAWAKELAASWAPESAYFQLQATKPQSLSYAMMDSPVGIAAWLIEKFNSWSDTKGGNIESCYTKDQLLTNIMIYCVTRTFNTASWQYRGFAEEGSVAFPGGQRVEVPVGIADYPKNVYSFPPERMVKAAYNVVHWRKMPRGGHFASLEVPDLFTDDLVKFARMVR